MMQAKRKGHVLYMKDETGKVVASTSITTPQHIHPLGKLVDEDDYMAI